MPSLLTIIIYVGKYNFQPHEGVDFLYSSIMTSMRMPIFTSRRKTLKNLLKLVSMMYQAPLLSIETLIIPSFQLAIVFQLANTLCENLTEHRGWWLCWIKIQFSPRSPTIFPRLTEHIFETPSWHVTITKLQEFPNASRVNASYGGSKMARVPF